MTSFSFLDNGSSHEHRANLHAKTVIQEGHKNTLLINEEDSVVTIFPCVEQQLDYYNNQFFKQQHGHLIDYILCHLTQTDAEHKLSTQWGYSGKFDSGVPRWIMREWCSFWIADVLNSSYDVTLYSKIKSVARLSTQDIFENFSETLINLVKILRLDITVSTDIIHKQHVEFLSAQKFHNSQIRCHQYLQDLLNDIDTSMHIQSIFDEAYMQHLLRQRNLEIQCDGLDNFPSTTKQLKLLVYENSNNHNQRRS